MKLGYSVKRNSFGSGIRENKNLTALNKRLQEKYKNLKKLEVRMGKSIFLAEVFQACKKAFVNNSSIFSASVLNKNSRNKFCKQIDIELLGCYAGYSFTLIK